MKIIAGTLMIGLLPAAWSMIVQAQDPAPTLVESAYQGQAYLSGGVGEGERERVRMREADFNTKIVFTSEGGAYLADVHVAVSDAKGRPVLDVASAGPTLLTTLPPGSYTVKASSDNQVREKRFRVAEKKRAGLVLRW